LSENPASHAALAAARAKLAPYWLHSPPLFVATGGGEEPSQLCFLEPALADRVVLLAFWQSTSLLARAQAAMVARWQAAYGARGFLAVGIHTPEFEFARARAHVAAEAAAVGIRYPVALDQDGAMARALAVERWPHLVLLDPQGEVVFEHTAVSGVGEGALAGAAEPAIRAALLASRPGMALPPPVSGAPPPVDAGGTGVEAAPGSAAAVAPVSPDLPCGFLRGSLGNRESRLAATGGVVDCALEHRRASDVLYLAGRWQATRESWLAVPARGNPSRLLVRCRAGEVHAILGPHTLSDQAEVTVHLGGRPVPPAMHGPDLTLVPDPGAGTASRTRPISSPGLLHLLSVEEMGPLDLELVVAERPAHVYGLRFGPPRPRPAHDA
jgi:hypothetical protein